MFGRNEKQQHSCRCWIEIRVRRRGIEALVFEQSAEERQFEEARFVSPSGSAHLSRSSTTVSSRCAHHTYQQHDECSCFCTGRLILRPTEELSRFATLLYFSLGGYM